MNLSILREMESFTQDMFNNIIGFQEKDHPTWNSEASFDERIAQLPLHYLVFSNPDRNPATHGPTVAHYYPLHWEMQTLADFARQLSDQAVICDAHARNGFIGSLLAREGVQVIGMRDPNDKPNQIDPLLDESCYERRDGDLSQVDFDVDMLISSWMPSGTDITAEVLRIKPKLVVYVFSDHQDEQTGQLQTGSPDAFGENLTAEYQLIDQWSVHRPENLFRDIWPDLTGNIAETRQVRIYARDEWQNINIQHAEDQPFYFWEKELHMAATALAAKQEMQKRGFPF